jgi:hypothetical protein
MKALTEFNPEFVGILRQNSGEGISFDCPVCGSNHRLVAYFDVPVDGKEKAVWQTTVWKRSGSSFNDLTLEPSIQYPCFHGWIENGQVIDIRESPATAIVNNQLIALSPMQFKLIQSLNSK